MKATLVRAPWDSRPARLRCPNCAATYPRPQRPVARFTCRRCDTIVDVPFDLRGTHRWPKQIPELTDEQTRARDAFMARWLEVLPARYSMIERFNQTFPTVANPTGRTLEIGAGLGAHIDCENLNGQDYYTLDLRSDLVAALAQRHPDVHAYVGDCQQRLPFDDGMFDRIIAIHVLEHLPDLPAAVDQIRRVLAPAGRLFAVIPCEGGLAYELARKVSAQRLFEREFGMDYEWLIRSEHVNVPAEIVGDLQRRFTIVRRRFFPFRAPSFSLNLVVGLELAPR